MLCICKGYSYLLDQNRPCACKMNLYDCIHLVSWPRVEVSEQNDVSITVYQMSNIYEIMQDTDNRDISTTGHETQKQKSSPHSLPSVRNSDGQVRFGPVLSQIWQTSDRTLGPVLLGRRTSDRTLGSGSFRSGSGSGFQEPRTEP